jgi:pimeloyl-ACP methyl ester carboxylesterase
MWLLLGEFRSRALCAALGGGAVLGLTQASLSLHAPAAGRGALAAPSRRLAARAGGCAPVPLASTLVQPALPTTVLVHGLDSCKETWSKTLAALAAAGLPALAVDLRGHGESPLGDPGEPTRADAESSSPTVLSFTWRIHT